ARDALAARDAVTDPPRVAEHAQHGPPLPRSIRDTNDCTRQRAPSASTTFRAIYCSAQSLAVHRASISVIPNPTATPATVPSARTTALNRQVTIAARPGAGGILHAPHTPPAKPPSEQIMITITESIIATEVRTELVAAAAAASKMYSMTS